MVHRISHFSVAQTSKVVAAIYFLFGLLYIPLGFIIEATAPPEEKVGLWFWILFPAILAVFVFIAVALGCVIYNAVAKHIGGIEVTLDPSEG